MMQIEQAALTPDAAIKFVSQPRMTDAWRQAHFAAQAAAELGKSWAEEADDDSHSSLAWVDAPGFRGLEGVAAAGDRPLRARLDVERLALSVVDDGRTIGAIDLAERTVGEATQWIAEIAERELGPRRQPAQPAPDLPDHPLGRDASFKVDADALRALATQYRAAAGVLERLRRAAPEFDAPRCWPHHFDLASLAVTATDDEGEMTKTIGVGLTPPDTIESGGYWYVSPWSKRGRPVAGAFRTLPEGRWVDRGSGAPMAALPLHALSGVDGPEERVARFVAAAVNACALALAV